MDHGKLRVYLNTRTNQQPDFKAFEWFQAGGNVVSVPAGCAVGFTPQLVDYDGDGRTDIVTGSFHGGLLYVFLRQKDGSFSEASVIENKDGDVRLSLIPYNSTVFVHDWDRDGDKDLVLGRANYSWVPNNGNSVLPAFGTTVRITVGGEPVPRGIVAPCVADWDGDGRDDFIAGLKEDVVWYRNRSDSGEPDFDSPRILVAATDRGPSTAAGPDSERSGPSRFAHAVCVTDFNADGRVDLLLGDHYYLPRQLPQEQLDEYAAISKTRSVFWQELQSLIADRPTSETRQARIEKFRRALANWRALSSTPFTGPQAANFRMERHGGVWFYERLAAK